MEGPYRDLGAGFARLTGLEGTRRGPSRIDHVEDALFELLRNARDAGAARVYVASSLKDRRFRTLTVIDDGHGLPESHRDLIFEPGVTTRHLDPVPEPTDPAAAPHGAGLSLYHIRTAALSAEVLSPSSPTSIRITTDTHSLPERDLQSTTRPSQSNLRATLRAFVTNPNPQPKPARLQAYYGSPARILATLIRNRIIQPDSGTIRVKESASEVGLELSSRTVQRILRGEVRPLASVSGERGPVGGSGGSGRGKVGDGPVFALGEEEREEIAAILGRAARAGYLEVEDVRFEARPGEVSIRASVYEPEEEYE
ncbi:MAG: ATP-binding protein [Rubrobacter sp.]